MQWWGYIHTENTVHVKRFFSQLDIQEAKMSPFCKEVVGPFEAENREDAIRQVKERTNHASVEGANHAGVEEANHTDTEGSSSPSRDPRRK